MSVIVTNQSAHLGLVGVQGSALYSGSIQEYRCELLKEYLSSKCVPLSILLDDYFAEADSFDNILALMEQVVAEYGWDL